MKVLLETFDLINMFAQNIHCDEEVLMSTHNVCFGPK